MCVYKLVQVTSISCYDLKGMPSLLVAVLEPHATEFLIAFTMCTLAFLFTSTLTQTVGSFTNCVL